MELKFIDLSDETGLNQLSELATAILRDFYDPIVGVKQNDYMLDKFQSVAGIKEHLGRGATYALVMIAGEAQGFIAYEVHEEYFYISKFYLTSQVRGQGYGRELLECLVEIAQSNQKNCLRLNVNKYNPSLAIYEKLGFERIRAEENDIGQGYIMDDYVLELKLAT